MNKKIFIFTILSILLAISNIICSLELLNIPIWIKILLIICNFILVIGLFLCGLYKNSFLFKLIHIIIIFSTFLIWLYYIISISGYSNIFSSISTMQDFIKSTGIFSIIVFSIIQFAQVVFLPLPSFLTIMVGSILFGPTISMIISLISIIIGSYVAYIIGKFIGNKIMKWIIGKKACEKYTTILQKKGKYSFFLMMLFPIFPDDLLCFIAGMISLDLKFFTCTILISRIINIVPICYFGSGQIIPFEGVGIIIWIIIIIVLSILFILSYKYQDKIERFLLNLFNKKH